MKRLLLVLFLACLATATLQADTYCVSTGGNDANAGTSNGAVAGWMAMAFTNTTGAPIQNNTIRFNGEQWRNGGNTTAQTMVLQYGFGNAFLTVPTWTKPRGNFNWANPLATAAAVDGNVAGRVNSRGGTLHSINWTNNSTLWIRWVELNDAGNNHGLAIDDFTLSVPNASTITTLTSSANPSITGNNVMFTATVTSDGNPVTTGTVTFSEGAIVLDANVPLNGSGQATFSTTALTEGSHVITATYNGAMAFTSSNGSIVQVVNNMTVVNGNSFCNTGSITLPDGNTGGIIGTPGTPYPSNIVVSGLLGTITSMTVDIKGLTHGKPQDIDLLLVAPTGETFIIMSGVGGGSFNNTNLTLSDDPAASALPRDAAIPSGTYRPASYEADNRNLFPAPAPAGPYNQPDREGTATFASVFNGINPNDTWQLYATDDTASVVGSIANGWCLNIMTSTPPTLGTYPPTSVDLGDNTTVTPSTAPTDALYATATTTADFKGELEVDPTTGVVRITNAHPAGTYTVTVTAYGEGNTSTTQSFQLTVNTVGCTTFGANAFAAAQNLGVGDVPYSVAVGDFNGDGLQDLAVANLNSDNVSVLLRKNDNSGFDAKVDFGVGDAPQSVAVGDFNGDGRQDLATANGLSNDVSVLLRKSDNTGFEPKVDYGALDPISVAVGDFNGDGRPDLAVANVTTDNVSVLLRKSDNTGFDPKVDYAVGDGPVSVAVGDFNGDGRQDLAVANAGSNDVSVLLRKSDNTGFDPKLDFTAGDQPVFLAVGDFNGDERPDLATANLFSDDVSVLLRKADNTGFDTKVDVGVGDVPRSVAVGDFNGDGRQDLAVANLSSANVSVLLRKVDNTGFDPKVDVAAGAQPRSVAVGDFNGDGKQDLAVANQSTDNVSILERVCCPDLSAPAPAAVVANSTCNDDGCFPTGGSISAPQNACPDGATFQYSTDNGNTWSTTPPVYKLFEPLTILTRCNCDEDNSLSSPTNSVMTAPEVCATNQAIWQQLGMDIDGDEREFYAGTAVAISADGNTVVMGAPGNQNGLINNNSGKVRVFRNVGGTWTQLGSNINAAADFEAFGDAVAIAADGNTIVVGAPRKNSFTGVVRAYQYSGGNWTQIGSDINGDANFDNAGNAVSISEDGTIIAVGIYGGNGKVRIYKNVGGTWTQVGNDLNPAAGVEQFGRSVSLSQDGTIIAIGASTGQNKVLIYQNVNDTWMQVGNDINGDAENDFFGYSVALSDDGSTVAVGVLNKAQARVYKNVNGIWTQLGGNINGEAAGDGTGFSVAISADGSIVAVGAPYKAGQFVNVGNTRMFSYENGTWEQIGMTISSEDDFDDRVGWSVSLSDDGYRVAVGAPFNGNGNIDGNKGHVRVFEIGCCPDLNAQAPAAVVVNSTCNDDGCLPIGGSISTPANACPDGATFQYSTDNGDTWSTTPPIYDQFTAITILTRCACEEDNTKASPTNSITTAPAACGDITDLFWQQLGLDIDGEVADDQFGRSVSVSSDGNTVAIGAPFNYGNGNGNGYVRVYQFIGGSWTQLGADIDGEAADDRSGFSVSLSADGSRLAIGAPRSDNFSGQVRVYEFSAGSWTQLGADIDSEAANDQFGHSVSISSDGNTVAIGARLNGGTGTNAGHVRVYRYNGGDWVQLGADIDAEAAFDNFGWSVSISSDGNTVAIGAPENDGIGSNAGHVRVYRYNGNAWVQVGADIDGEAEDDQSGYSVSLSSDGNAVAIGAFLNDGIGNFGNDAGHVRVYRYNGSAWVQVGADIDAEAVGDNFGSSVSLSSDGNTVAIGAPRNDGNGNFAGHVRVYRYNGSAWVQVDVDINGEAEDDQSGYSVSLSADGTRLAIGAPFNASGHVRVYELGCVQCEATLSGTTTICAGETGNLVVNVTDGSGPYTVEIDNNGDMNADITINNYTSGSNIPVTPTATTTYTLLSVIDNGGNEVSCEVSGTATITVNPKAEVEAGNVAQAICLTKTVNLTQIGASITRGGASFTGTWSILEADSDGQFLPSNVFGNATTFKPGKADGKRGYVTLVLTSDDPDGEGPCEPVSDQVRITILNVDCGQFPWNGNE